MTDPRRLAGRWRLDRTLLDRATGQRGCVHGTLTVTPDGDWFESGQLTWAGHTTAATRRTRLRRLEDGWWVLFADGRPFHPWQPGRWVTHQCREDRYRGLITVAADETAMRTVWRVRGPAKDQQLTTRLRRCPL